MTEEQLNGAASHDEAADDIGDDVDDVRQPSEDEERLIELVGFLVQGLVTHPEEVEVDELFDDIGIVYGVRVHPEDVGRVIGKEGRVANALRQVVRAAATKTGARIALEIITDDDPIELINSDDAPPQ